jgi:Uri superfamily endonuclease
VRGVYAAIFRVGSDTAVEVGTLGEIEFREGLYIYVGSAMNGVEPRLRRHFSEVENRHWHIDYFSAEAEPEDYLVLPAGAEAECRLAEAASRIASPVDGFGASDCDCSSHLFRAEV